MRKAIRVHMQLCEVLGNRPVLELPKPKITTWQRIFLHMGDWAIGWSGGVSEPSAIHCEEALTMTRIGLCEGPRTHITERFTGFLGAILKIGLLKRTKVVRCSNQLIDKDVRSALEERTILQ